MIFQSRGRKSKVLCAGRERAHFCIREVLDKLLDERRICFLAVNLPLAVSPDQLEFSDIRPFYDNLLREEIIEAKKLLLTVDSDIGRDGLAEIGGRFVNRPPIIDSKVKFYRL